MSHLQPVTAQFVTIDGPNGVGKTTFGNTLADRLEREAVNVLQVAQPSDTDLGNFARSSERTLIGLPLASVVVADRYLQIDRVIRPALAKGDTVICDRYVASTLALQRLDGLALELLWDMNAQALVPDLAILLSADPAVIEARLDHRGRTSRFERQASIAARETQLFAEAFERLGQAGYSTLEISTTTSSPTEAIEAVSLRLIAAARP